jgi:hypothetical protein
MLRRWRDWFNVWFRRRRDPPSEGPATMSRLEQAKMRETANRASPPPDAGEQRERPSS